MSRGSCLQTSALLLAGLCLLGSLRAADEAPALGEAPSRRTAPAITPTPVPTSTPMSVVKPEELKAAEARLNQALTDQRHSLDELNQKLRALSLKNDEQSQAIAKQAEDAKALADAIEASQKKMADGLKQIADIQAGIERKGEKMQGLLDIISTVKRDMNDNSHEIAEIKHDIEALKKASAAPVDDDEAPWWKAVLGWRYMPVTAAILGGAALIVSVSHR